jgi:hypothetical protein
MPRRGWLIALCALILTVLVYAPVFDMSFYAEDPLDVGQIRYVDALHILTTNTSNLYYRPLAWLLMKSAERPDTTFDPRPFHVAHVLTHALNVGLICVLAWQLTGDGVLAILAAALLAFYPYSYDAVARTTPLQPFIITLLLLTLLLYLRGRVRGQRRWLWLSLVPLIIGFPTLENALLFGFIVVAFEALLFIRKMVPRPIAFPLLHIGASVPFILIWLSIPKSGSALSALFDGRVGNLFIQTALWPIGVALEPIMPQPNALIVLGLGVIFIGGLYWHSRKLSDLILPLSFWIVSTLPVWLVRNYKYVEISPRVFYIAIPGLALMWAGLVAIKLRRARLTPMWRIESIVIVALIAFQNLVGLLQIQTLYRQGSQLMDQMIDAAQQAGSNSNLLFVDFPDRFTLQQQPWPFGWWGMLLAPVSMDLNGYADLTRGVKPNTRSISLPTLSASERDIWPYDMNPRGATPTDTQLAEDIAWADGIYRTHFQADGSLRLDRVGAINHATLQSNTLARFGDAIILNKIETNTPNGKLQVTFWWQCLKPLQSEDTVFVHLYLGNDLIDQSDGDSLGGLLPIGEWHAGDVIEDVRTFNHSSIVLIDYRVGIGFYNRSTDARLSAIDPNGSALPDNTLFVPIPDQIP